MGDSGHSDGAKNYCCSWMIPLTTKLRKCNDDSIHENYTSPSSLFLPKMCIKYRKLFFYKRDIVQLFSADAKMLLKKF